MTGKDLGGGKPRQLLEMLALDLGKPIAKDLLAERLWDGRPPESYIATVESYMCLLRRKLGLAGGRRGPLATTPKGYLLDSDVVAVDVLEVRGLLRGEVDDVARALDRLPGELLADDPYAPWASAERETFAELLGASCIAAAREANGRGDFALAVRLASEATRRSQFSEPARRELMKGLLGAGDRVQALQVYEALRVSMRDELGLEPEATTRELYRAILSSGDDAGGRWDQDEIVVLLRLLRRALESDSTMVIGLPSMFEVGQLLLARAG